MRNKIFGNIFLIIDAENDATNFLKEAEKNVGSSKVILNFCNEEGQLKPNKIGIDSFIKYISAGGGTWKIRTINSNGEREYISSEQKSTKINIPITYEELKNESLNLKQQKIINDCFDQIETIEKFKEQR